MASAKKDVTDPQALPASQDFDYSQYLPEGFDAKDLRKVGGLTPVYNAELAVKNKWAPCVGKIVTIDILDMGEEHKEHKQRFREFLLVEVTTPTKGTTGNKRDGHEEVDVEAGSDIYVPISGNLKNIKVLQAAVQDPRNVYLGIFRATGEKKNTGKPTDMNVIDVRVHTKTFPREGRFLLRESPAPASLSGGGVTSSGATYDGDGVVQDHPVQQRAQA